MDTGGAKAETGYPGPTQGVCPGQQCLGYWLTWSSLWMTVRQV